MPKILVVHGAGMNVRGNAQLGLHGWGGDCCRIERIKGSEHHKIVMP